MDDTSAGKLTTTASSLLPVRQLVTSPVLLMLAAGSVSISLAQNSILASIGLTAARHGPTFFGWVSLCLMAPSLPVALLQYASNDWLDRRVGVFAAYALRCGAPVLAQVVGLLVFGSRVLTSDTTSLVAVALVVGCASASLFGTAQQLAALADAQTGHDGGPHVAFALGFQASGVVVLVARNAAAFDHDATRAQATWFYSAVALANLLSLVALAGLLRALTLDVAVASPKTTSAARATRHGALFITVCVASRSVTAVTTLTSCPQQQRKLCVCVAHSVAVPAAVDAARPRPCATGRLCTAHLRRALAAGHARLCSRASERDPRAVRQRAAAAAHRAARVPRWHAAARCRARAGGRLLLPERVCGHALLPAGSAGQHASEQCRVFPRAHQWRARRHGAVSSAMTHTHTCGEDENYICTFLVHTVAICSCTDSQQRVYEMKAPSRSFTAS